MNSGEAIATLGGGCFWCMQKVFDEQHGIEKTIVGYSNGYDDNPTYDTVCSGTSGYIEVIQIHFTKISYTDLLNIFWKNIDPTTNNQQMGDKGPQYQTAIFYHTEQQKQEALESKQALELQYNFKIQTIIEPYKNFYPAEEFHQKYYKHYAARYRMYNDASKRDVILEHIWNKQD